MSSSSRFEAYRSTVQEQVLPLYESLGHLTLVYLLGSLVSGYTEDADFAYGELAWDRKHLGQQWKSRLSGFPPKVKQECQRAVLVHQQVYLTDLRTLMGRADWFKFHCLLVEAVRTTLRALFALHGVYYSGDKWLRQSILRFGLGEEVLTSFDRLFEAKGSAQERAIEQHAALSRLMDLVEGYED